MTKQDRPSYGLSEDELREKVVASRRAQGLPDFVEDEEALRWLANLITETLRRKRSSPQERA